MQSYIFRIMRQWMFDLNLDIFIYTSSNNNIKDIERLSAFDCLETQDSA